MSRSISFGLTCATVVLTAASAAGQPSGSQLSSQVVRPAPATAPSSGPGARQPQGPPLDDLAKKVATELASSTDPAVKTASCSLLEEAPGTPCSDDKPNDDRTRARISELKQEAAAGEPQAMEQLHQAKDELLDSNPLMAVEAIAALPGTEGVDDLEKLVESDQPEVRRKAAAAMSGKDPGAARDLVDEATKGNAPSDVGFAAALGLVRQGDRDQVKQVSEWLPRLTGRNRLEAAGALAAAGHTEGTQALTEIAERGADDQLQLEAAAALLESRPEVTAEVVERGLASPNIWVRGQAAALASRLGPEWAERVRSVLATDASPWVRLQAAAGVLRK